MGEIGIKRLEFLYELSFCDILLIERGYARRHMHLWSATRWETFYIMAAFAGTEKLKEAGIYSPSDLLKLPWDNQNNENLPTEEEVKELQDLMASINAHHPQQDSKSTEA